MLPVKTPKVPPTAPQPPVIASAVPSENAASFTAAATSISCKSGSGTDANERAFAAEATAKTAVISKLLPKMKR